MTTYKRLLALGAAGVFATLVPGAGAVALTEGTPAPAAAVNVTNFNDVMDGKTPRLPVFPKLAKKPGYLRGYVKDASGKPLSGAYVMILPAALYGGFSKQSITVRTNAQGLYEVQIPTGGCQVWCAGYAVDYNGVRLALPLHPADGELDNLDKANGDIENFALLSYGVANPSSVSDNPRYSGGYYGASFTVSYSTREADDAFAPKEWLVLGSEIEITLTPDGPLMDSGAGRTLVLRRKLTPTSGSYFQVNNVPIGRYRIRARVLEDGKTAALRLKENGNGERAGGMTPRETDDEAVIIFRSATGDPKTLRVPNGNMERLELLVERAG